MTFPALATGNPVAVAKRKDHLDKVADELYGLPPGDFTEARDALVKRLRADRERELANEVKSLRKPTLAAWALNQLVRNRRKDVDKLLAAGDQLRKAQEQLVANGDRAGFQRAALKERELVAQLARDAASLAAEAGEGSSQGLEEKLAATLHAASLDEDTAAELAAGRVLRERQPVAGFGGLEPAPQPPQPSPRRAKAAKADKTGAERRKREQAEQAEARAALQAARLEERTAGREHDAAAKAAGRAAERLAKAEERAADATRKLDEARRELEEAERQEREAAERHENASEAVDAAEKRVS
jgi:DNA repair exonuclease SbcCD ATPase subunit